MGKTEILNSRILHIRCQTIEETRGANSFDQLRWSDGITGYFIILSSYKTIVAVSACGRFLL